MQTSPQPRDPNKRLVLFHRDFQRFTGGHLKVWDYFNHVLASPDYEPRIAFTSDSKWDQTNPWSNAREYVGDWKPDGADVLFVAGKDWKHLAGTIPANGGKPVINLIQHPRHADTRDQLHVFLTNRAVRICVSQQVADAINATGRVNGPVVVIPNGANIKELVAVPPNQQRPTDVLICGLKAPDLARRLDKRLRQDENVRVTPLLDWTRRPEYLQQLGRAKIVVTLPRPTEGFYLPALEAMASGAIVICPDCLGNRDFCLDRVNCFRPGYDLDELTAAVYRAFALSPDEADTMRSHAAATVRQHSLDREREEFLRILGRLDELWG
jgi:glycosyltransferase involved in cell wall biosynthesis